MPDRQKLKLYAALFSACYLASRGLFAAAHATKGTGCGCASGFLTFAAIVALGTGLLGLVAVGSIAIARAHGLKSTLTPSGLLMLPTAFIFFASVPWIFGLHDPWFPPVMAEIGSCAPFAFGAAALLLVLSVIKERRRSGLPAARVIK